MGVGKSDSDHRLVKGCKRQQPKAQRALYEKYFSTMMRVCLRYAKNPEDAGEMLNDGFLKVFKRIESFGGKGSLEGWIRRIMVHTAIDRLRQQQTYEAHLVQYQAELGDTHMKNEAVNRLEAEDVFHHLQALPPMSRAVFNLFAIEGYAHKEIAKMLEMSEGTSQWHLSTARKRLQALLPKEKKRVQSSKVQQFKWPSP